MIPKKAVILAAGESSRFWPLNLEHKALFKLMGKPLLFYLIKALNEAKISQIIIVQSPKRDIEKKITQFSFSNLKFVIQPKPLGTGDALLKAEKLIKEPFLLMNAERIDFLDFWPQILKKAKEKKNVLLASKDTKKTFIFGILKIKDEKLLEIVEKPSLKKAPSNFKNVGLYLFFPEIFSYLKKVKSSPFSLIEAVNLLAKKSKILVAFAQKKPLFLKFPWDLFSYQEYLFEKFLENKVSKSAQISKLAQIEGKVQIEKNVKILGGVKIEGPCYIGQNSFLEENSKISHSNIEENCFLGSFCYLSNCLLEENVCLSFNHLGWSILGKNCKISPGTVFAWIPLDKKMIFSSVKGKKISTGLKNLGAILGENVKVGINSSLMPGVMIGKDSIVGPCSFVKENIKEGECFCPKFENFNQQT